AWLRRTARAGRRPGDGSIHVRGARPDRGRPASGEIPASPSVRRDRKSAVPRRAVGGANERQDADCGARGDDGGDLCASHRQRPRDRPLHRRRLARPRLRGALFPHLPRRGRGRVYAVLYCLPFLAGGAAVTAIAFLHGRGGFDLVLGTTATIALGFVFATAVIAVLVNGVEKQRSRAVAPAE